MRKMSIICYGDSNTFGHDPENGGRYPADKLWTSILEKALPQGSRVINCGMNGRTTAFDRDGSPVQNGLESLESVLSECPPSDMIIFMLGTNDTSKLLRLSASEIAGGMEKLAKKARGYCTGNWGYLPEMMIVCPPAIRQDISSSPFRFMIDSESVRVSRSLAPEYEKTAHKLGCLFLDATGLDGVSPKDSMHLTEEGHRALAGMIYGAIEKSR